VDATTMKEEYFREEDLAKVGEDD